MWLWIISQVIGVFYIILWIYVYQLRDKDKQIKRGAFGNVLSIVINLMVFNFLKAAMKVISILKTLVFFKTRKDGKHTSYQKFVLFFSFCLINATMTFLIWFFVTGMWFDFILLAGMFLLNWGKLFGNIHYLKFSGFIWNVIALVNGLIFMNITGSIVNVFILVSIAVFYARRGYREKSVPLQDVHEVDDVGLGDDAKQLAAACPAVRDDNRA